MANNDRLGPAYKGVSVVHAAQERGRGGFVWLLAALWLSPLSRLHGANLSGKCL
jgi:hypothetical protein